MSNVPKLRFKEFSGKWEEKHFFDCIKEVLDFRGRTPLKLGMDWGNGDIISLSANNVKNGYIDLNAECHLGSISLYEKWMGKVNLEKNDIVFTMEAPLGKALLVPDDRKYILSQRVVAFKTKEDISNEFLIQLIWSNRFQNTIDKLSTGSTAKGINQKSLKKVSIVLPSKQEQEKIASFLTSVDTKIEQLSRIVELLESYKKGVMQAIFAGGKKAVDSEELIVDSDKDNSKFKIKHLKFKKDDGSEFPEWEEKKLGDIGTVITGKTPSTSNDELWDGNIEFITPTDIEGSKYQTKTSRTVTEQPKMNILPIGTIVYTCIASIGKMSLSTRPSITNQQINSLVVYEQHNNEFVYYALLKLTPYIQSTQANTTLPIINKTEFSKFKVSVPCLEEQTKIANFLSSIDNKIEQTKKQLDGAKKFKKALLQQMFV
jgi:type I restriction enzyme S subunit